MSSAPEKITVAILATLFLILVVTTINKNTNADEVVIDTDYAIKILNNLSYTDYFNVLMNITVENPLIQEHYLLLTERLMSQVSPDGLLKLAHDMYDQLEVDHIFKFLVIRYGLYKTVFCFVIIIYCLIVVLYQHAIVILQFFRVPQQFTRFYRRYHGFNLVTDDDNTSSDADPEQPNNEEIPIPTGSQPKPKSSPKSPKKASKGSPVPEYTPEKHVAGSDFIKTPPPSCQVRITAYNTDGIVQHTGCGFRGENNELYTAHHVIQGAHTLVIQGNSTSNITVSPSVFLVNTMADLAIATLPAASWSILATKSSIFLKKYTGPCQVTISNGSKASVGELVDSPFIYSTEYRGSTEPGFSGAPYVLNGTIYGMHVGYGSTNFGLSSHAIDFLFRLLIDSVSENKAKLRSSNNEAEDARTSTNANYPAMDGLEKNKKGKNKNRKSRVDDDSYLQYAAEHSKKTGTKLLAAFYNGYNDDHGVVIKGKGGRIVFADTYDSSFMELSRTTKKDYDKEALDLFKDTSKTVQFVDEQWMVGSSFLVKPADV
jgi:hypothetical protein